MPGPATIPAGNVSFTWVLNATLTPASVSNGVSAEQTFTVPGLRTGDFVAVSKPTTQANLIIGNVRVSAKDTIAINFANVGAATITPTAGEVYTVKVDRYENYALAGSAPAGYPG
jgi:hypothetical protein